MVSYIVLISLFLGFLGYYWFVKYYVFPKRSDLTPFPVLSSKYATVGVSDEWRFEYIQPFLKNFFSQDGVNYLEVFYYDTDNKRHNIKLFISGGFKSEAVDGIGYGDGTDSGLIDFAELKTKIKPGQQVGIEYLAKPFPKFFRTEQVCAKLGHLCLLADIMEEKSQEAEGATFLVATAIYTDLYEE